MSESFGVCNAGSGSQQASAESPPLAFSALGTDGETLLRRPRLSLFAPLNAVERRSL